MALYRVLEQSFVNNVLVDVGAVVEFAGEAGDNMEAIKGNAVKGIDPATVVQPPILDEPPVSLV